MKSLDIKQVLAAQDFSQRPEIDYIETYSPMVDAIICRYLINLAVHEILYMHLMDIVTAYLYGTLDNEIYMKIPEVFKVPEAYKGLWEICSIKLQKFLYGVKQSRGMQYNRFSEYLMKESTSRDVRNPGSYTPSDCASTRVNPFRAEGTGLADAFDKLKSKLLHHDVGLRKALDEERYLRHEKEIELAHLRYEALEGEGALAKVPTFEPQLCLARDEALVQTNMITKLESDLPKVRAEIVDAWAEAIMSRTKADQEMAIYLKDATHAQAELRKILDSKGRIEEYARISGQQLDGATGRKSANTMMKVTYASRKLCHTAGSTANNTHQWTF
uniref:Uncharacterized protein LOC104229270 n=1 Tax=Nicotiana sylvestris TaxID=4096 RepID=A0A1U7WS99_NICSY|nr:PREDICTED: uncharacterized protein LOC104229270 [Nicotiana sylvestris]